jgi:hypothetical protein
LLKEVLVTGDGVDQDSRHQLPRIIELGIWSQSLLDAMTKRKGRLIWQAVLSPFPFPDVPWDGRCCICAGIEDAGRDWPSAAITQEAAVSRFGFLDIAARQQLRRANASEHGKLKPTFNRY